MKSIAAYLLFLAAIIGLSHCAPSNAATLWHCIGIDNDENAVVVHHTLEEMTIYNAQGIEQFSLSLSSVITADDVKAQIATVGPYTFIFGYLISDPTTVGLSLQKENGPTVYWRCK